MVISTQPIGLTLLLISSIAWTSAFQWQQWQVFSTQAISATSYPMEISETYASSSLASEEELYAVSDLVFMGQVLGFSSSSWNRDNNSSPISVEEWESTPIHIYHQVELRVIKPILGTKTGQVIHVNVLGSSPIAKIGPRSTWTIPNDGDLKVGSKGIFFLTTNGQSAWMTRSGQTFMKTVTTFSTGETGQSYFPEKNGFYVEFFNKPVKLETIESKVRQYTSAREKYFRNWKQN